MNAVLVTHAGIASGVNNAVSRTAGLLAIALVTLPLLGIFNAELGRRLAALPLRSDVAHAVRDGSAQLANLEAPAFATPAERVQVERAVKESFVAGFRFVAWAAAALAFLSAATAALLLRGTRATR
jgi:hypothetical protein